MRKNMKLFLVPALLLMLAVLAGCSQADDALPDGTVVARGGEPLNIRIVPKPGYTESINTRTLVNDDTGKVEWFNDNIILFITFNDAAATTVKFWGACIGGEASWYMNELRDDLTGSPAISKFAWPLGASSATVTACYSDNLSNVLDASGYSITKGDDYMWFSKTVTLGETLTIDFAHSMTRLSFSGLERNTEYKLKVNGVAATFPSYANPNDLTPCEYAENSFSSDGRGYITVHVALNDKLDADGKMKLELVKNGETTPAYQNTFTAQGAAGAYKMDGYLYKITAVGSGGINPDRQPDDLIGILYNGQSAQLLNFPEATPYWVAPENAATNVAWTDVNFATVCPEGWHVPTQNDYYAMFGISTWSDNIPDAYFDVIKAVFPEGKYWSATATSSSHACVMQVYSFYADVYGGFKSDNSVNVRCVRAK